MATLTTHAARGVAGGIRGGGGGGGGFVDNQKQHSRKRLNWKGSTERSALVSLPSKGSNYSCQFAPGIVDAIPRWGEGEGYAGAWPRGHSKVTGADAGFDAPTGPPALGIGSDVPKAEQRMRGAAVVPRAFARDQAVGADWRTSLSFEQAAQLQAQEEESRLFRHGPPQGDVAEVEAFCRIYRLAEQLHSAVMDGLRSLGPLLSPSSPSSPSPPPPPSSTLPSQAESNGASSVSERGDVSEAEELVVAGLARIGAVLERYRSVILGGASEKGKMQAPLPPQFLPGEDSSSSLPPLANMRRELKAACLSLQEALVLMFAGVGRAERGAPLMASPELRMIRRRLERLKNVCLDAGFPRPEEYPSNADIPNFAPVKLRPSRRAPRPLSLSDPEVAFWRGGQLTKEGLAWLLENGLRTVVDMRADDRTNQWSDPGLEAAVSSGAIKCFRVPVQFECLPSKEQVELLAWLVDDSARRPLYLHSQGGTGRSCGMVARWRELVIRGGLGALDEEKMRQMSKAARAKPVAARKREEAATGSGEDADQGVCEGAEADWKGSLGRGIDKGEVKQQLHEQQRKPDTALVEAGIAGGAQAVDDGIEAYDCSEEGRPAAGSMAATFAGVSSDTEEGDQQPVGGKAESTTELQAEEGVRFTRGKGEGDEPAAESSAAEAKPQVWVAKNVFEAQRPKAADRRSMARFFERKKGSVSSALIRNPTASPLRHPTNGAAAGPGAAEVGIGTLSGPAGRWQLAEPGIPRAEVTEVSVVEEQDVVGGELRGNGSVLGTGEGSRNVEQAGPVSAPFKEVDLSTGEELPHPRSSDGGEREEAGGSELAEVGTGDRQGKGGEEGLEEAPVYLDGDMCASTTGVVRVQSRQKAEMYLVRTDGFSCTRERVKESTLAFTHPSTQQQMLMWKTRPKTVLLLKKLGNELMSEAKEVALFLHNAEGMNVVVEPEVHDIFARVPGFGFVQTYYNQDTSHLHERVDLVVCLGGDGVILHASNLFRDAVPPVVSFNLGSLGFLTAHRFDTFRTDLASIINGNRSMAGIYITLRMRLRCELFRNGKPIPGKVFDVLNEVVVDRGSNPYLSKIECYERNRIITKVQADGVILATPTGSTAYSTAAGGSMVHPNVPCMLFTPICPHSLSFRPIILPDSALIELRVPEDVRSNCWVSFDGKKRQQLSRGDSVRVRMSEHPMPTVNKSDQTDDWFASLVRCLNWNERLEQKAFASDLGTSPP